VEEGEPGEAAQAVEPAQPPEPAQPIDAKVVSDWEAAGGEYGWVRIDELGITSWQPQSEEPGPGALAGFRFEAFPAGKLAGLPQPEVPFGLYLEGCQVNDQHLKELVGFERLRILGLAINQITDEGVAQLATLKGLRSLDLTENPITSACMKHVGRLQGLQTLDLNQTLVGDDGVRQIAGLKNLWMLDLTATGITDEALKHVGKLPRLRMLYLNGLPSVTDAGMAHLKACSELEFLSMNSTGITGEGLAHLAGLKKLTTFRANVMWSDAGLDALGKFKQLRVADVMGASLGGGRLEKLAGLTNLEELRLSYTRVGDEDLRALRGMKNLMRLNLQGNDNVTDEGLAHLMNLKKLKWLHLSGTGVTTEGAAKLKEALPELEVKFY